MCPRPLAARRIHVCDVSSYICICAHAADRGCLRHLVPGGLHSPHSSYKHLPTATGGSVGDERLTCQRPQYSCSEKIIFLGLLSETTTNHLVGRRREKQTQKGSAYLDCLVETSLQRPVSRSAPSCHCSLRHHGHPEAQEAPEKLRRKEGKCCLPRSNHVFLTKKEV